MIKYILFACCLLVTAGLSAQAVANAVLNKTRVETGDTFGLRVLLNNVPAEPLKVDFTSWAPQVTAENILSESQWSKAGTRWQRQYTLLVFDSAKLDLPALAVLLRNGEKVMTNSVQITIWPTPVGKDLSDAETIRDIVREPVIWIDYWPWAAGAVVVVLLLARLFKKKPKPPVQIIAPPPVQAPPHEVTLRQLAALEQQKPWKNGRTEQFYAELSMIMRDYLQRRFKIPALESTTREILPMLQQTDFPDSQSKTLKDVLYQSDMAKFAGQTPADPFHEKNLHQARQVVLASSPFVDSPKPYSNL